MKTFMTIFFYPFTSTEIRENAIRNSALSGIAFGALIVVLIALVRVVLK